MTDIPIIFSAPMIRTILDGRKTMTRRLAWKSMGVIDGHDAKPRAWREGYDNEWFRPTPWQKVRPRDRLWVRETYSAHLYQEGCWYWADGNIADHDSERPRPSIHMPRWASRITLTVTATKLERLQDISEEDAIAEGCRLYVPGHGWITEGDLRCDPGYNNFLAPRLGFEDIWRTLHGADAWNANPEVIAISFKPELRNIDAPEAKAA